jgi:tetratricopeptide (TPR) repeat protein
MLNSVKFGLFASAFSLAQPAKAEWIETKTEHFTIYGDMTQQQAADYATKAERFDRMLRFITNIKDDSDVPIDRVVIYVVPSVETIRAMTRSSLIAGFYNSDAQGSLAVMPLRVPSEWGAGANHVLFHEYSHHILLSSTQTQYPGWIQEGLAELFGTAKIRDDGSILVGAPPQMRGYALHRQYQLNVEELLGIDGRKLSPEARDDKYARGWLLSHYLLLSNKRPGQFDAYLKQFSKGVGSVDAGRAAFGDLGRLNTELNVYNRVGKFPAIIVPASQTSVGKVTTRKLSPCEAKIMPSRLRSAAGVDEKAAAALVAPARSVAAECLNDAFVQRSLAEIEFDAKNNDAALAAAERAIELEPSNVMAWVYKGRVYARQKRWPEARSAFVRANRFSSDYALPLKLYYDSFMLAGQQPSKAAIDGLYRAVVLAPQDGPLRQRAAYSLIREGDLKTARTVLAPVAFSAHAGPDNPALPVLQKIDAGGDQASVMAEASKAKWNELGKE